MKAVIFALLLTLASMKTMAIEFVDKPFADKSSCDSKAVAPYPQAYYIWTQTKSSGIDDKPLEFDLKLAKPSGVVAKCNICEDNATRAECGFMTCIIDIKQYPLKSAEIVFPGTVPSELSEYEVTGWEKVKDVSVAKDVNCPETSFSNYLKIGALLFISLFLC